MSHYIVVLVTYDYYRFEDYLGIFDEVALNTKLAASYPRLAVRDSKVLRLEREASREFPTTKGTHYLIEEVTYD